MSTQPIPVRRPSRVPGAQPLLAVDLDAVAANTRALAARSRSLMAVVKADGFGLGSVAVARTALASGASWLGVTSLAEARALRSSGIDAPILSWLNGIGADWDWAAAAGVDIAVSSVDHLDAVAAATAPGSSARLHLHADTGMARDGADATQWLKLCTAARAAERRGLVRVVGLMGHLAVADQGPDVGGRAAFERFGAVAAGAGLRPTVRHLAATSATLHDPGARHDLSRVGAGLVGIDPSGRSRGVLRPVVTLTTPVSAVRDVGSGTAVGYGHSHLTGAPTRLVTLPVGYADGIPRVPSGTAEVLVHGQRRPIVGRVCMDQVVVDVGDLPVDDYATVVVLGPGHDGEPTLQEWAGWAGTIPHDILVGLGPRVARSYRSVSEVVPLPTSPDRSNR